jgi:hypothetical protein
LSFFHHFLSLESNSSPLPPCTSNWQAPISQQKVLILKIHGWTTDAQIEQDEYLICFCWALQNWCQLVYPLKLWQGMFFLESINVIRFLSQQTRVLSLLIF